MSPRTQANYIIYKFVDGFIPFLTPEFDALGLPLNKATTGSSKILPRWEICVGQLAKDLPIAVGSMYIKTFLSPAHKIAAEDIMKNLMAQFKKMLTEETWMDHKTQAEAVKKMNKMGSIVGYPEELLDDDLIVKYHADLQIKKKDSYLMKYRKISNFKKKVLAAGLK